MLTVLLGLWIHLFIGTLLPLLVYIQRMLLSVRLHIVTTFFIAAITHVMFQLLMHSLFPSQHHQLLRFLLCIIALSNSLPYFLSPSTLLLFYLATVLVSRPFPSFLLHPSPGYLLIPLSILSHQYYLLKGTIPSSISSANQIHFIFQ